ncbi:Secreted RxLR effector peptide protein [Phytophthora palmivora]|uniref:RxLR effector protein n=1 Tax=Phytophthora palmivora TaxID=4796 RepID=A0A2P4XVM3_9STRA|nr:Secreted RxLR effector peptide protein [Phytophthora palmivora]
MHLCFYPLVIASTIVLTVAADLQHPSVPVIASLDTVQPVETAALKRDGKRILRGNKNEDDSNEVLKLYLDDEERAGELAKQLSKIDDFKLAPKVSNFEENLMAKLKKNSMVQNLLDDFTDQRWPMKKLRSVLDFTRNTRPGTTKYEAYTLLRVVRKYNNLLAKAGPNAENNLGQAIAAKVDRNPLAKGLVDDFMNKGWTTKHLKDVLGNTKANSAVSPLNQDAYTALIMFREYNDIVSLFSKAMYVRPKA